MAELEEIGRFVVGLAGEITNNVIRGLWNASQNFTNQLTGLLTAISTQGASQVLGSFDGELTRFRDWIKSFERYMLLAGGDENQSKNLAYQTNRCAFSDDIQRYMVEYQENSWKNFKAELNVWFAEVNDSHHAFTMLYKTRQGKHEPVKVCTERLYALAKDAFTKVDKAVVESQLVGFLLISYTMTSCAWQS